MEFQTENMPIGDKGTTSVRAKVEKEVGENPEDTVQQLN